MPATSPPRAPDLDAPARAVLDAASRLLAAEGPEALTNRRLAAEAGTTTMTIYTRFGSKGGVLDALFVEGIDRLMVAQRATAMGPNEVESLCLAYRRAALDSPGHYRVVFGDAVPGWKPDEALLRRAFASWMLLRDAVFRVASNRRLRGNPDSLAWTLFATCHGLVSLELRGMARVAGDPDEAIRNMVAQVLGAT
jgi:AcrR family transcriptional regulator